MTTRNVKRTIWSLATAAALAAGVGGCKSNDERVTDADISADLVDQNRMLVRMALAENVYNGIAQERAVYPDDFEAGSAILNRLGEQRVEMLIDASRNSTQPIAVLRGGASDALYTARLDAVRQELIDGGIQSDAITLTDTHVGGRPQSSDRAIISYDRLMAGYAEGDGAQGSGGGDGRDRETANSGTNRSGINNTGSSNTRGQ